MLQDSWSPVTVPSSILATLIISAAPLQAPHRHFSILGSRRSRFPRIRSTDLPLMYYLAFPVADIRMLDGLMVWMLAFRASCIGSTPVR